MTAILPSGGYGPAPKPDPALPKRGRRMRAESPQRRRDMTIYRHRAPLFVAARRYVCESPWACGNRATQVHHRKGRRGALLLDESWWAASCFDCNAVKAEQTHTAEAYACNWKVSPDFPGDSSEKPILPAVTGC